MDKENQASTSLQQPSPPPLPVKSSWLRIFIIGGVILIVFLAGLVVYLVQVKRTAPPTGIKGLGIITGKVLIGPLCSVEPCDQNTINPYLGKEIVLKSKIGKIVNIKVNQNGSFSGQLDPGNYSLDLNECAYLGCGYSLPKTATIEAGKTTEVTIDIDTGIR